MPDGLPFLPYKSQPNPATKHAALRFLPQPLAMVAESLRGEAFLQSRYAFGVLCFVYVLCILLAQNSKNCTSSCSSNFAACI